MVKTQVGIYTIVITLFMVGMFVFEKIVKNKSRKHMCYWLIFVVYCVAVLWTTLLSRQPQAERIALLIPLKSYPLANQAYFDNVAAVGKDGIVTTLERIRSFLYAYNWLILNVMLFIPYGILAPRAFRRITNRKVLHYGALGSAIIELIQYVFKLGCFDIDDLLQNTIGIYIGYLISILFGIHQIRKDKK